MEEMRNWNGRGRKLAAGAVCAIIWIACNNGPSLSAETEQPFGAGNEPSIAFSRSAFAAGGPTQDTIVAQFNGGFAWSWNTTGTIAGWHFCSASSDKTSPCYVPMAFGQVGWNSDPFIAAAPTGGGVVAAAALASTVSDGSGMVTISVSLDGGHTFRRTHAVNDSGCSDGTMDQEAIAFDQSATLPTIWAVWRYNAHGTYGACVRGGTIDTNTAGINWFGPARELDHYDHAFTYGIGGVLIQPLGDWVTVMYQNTDHIFKDCGGGADIKWAVNWSGDRGITWSNSRLVLESTNFSWCTIGNHYIRALRNFWFIRDPTNLRRLWAAVNDTQYTAQVMFSDDEGLSWTSSTTAVFPSFYEPVLAADPSGRIALAALGSNEDGSEMTPFIMDRRLNVPDPTAWSLPYQAGTSFPSIPLKPCNQPCAPPYQNVNLCCTAVYSGDPNGNIYNCVNNLCVGQRMGGGGDYIGMTVVPPGAFGGTNERFAPAWTNDSLEASKFSAVFMSYVDVLQ